MQLFHFAESGCIFNALKIPFATHSSDQRYLKIRLSWPGHTSTVPNYRVKVKGNRELRCDCSHMVMSMKLGATWGDPFVDDTMAPRCVFARREELSSGQIKCHFRCTPAPNFSEALFILLRNYLDPGATICAVNYASI